MLDPHPAQKGTHRGKWEMQGCTRGGSRLFGGLPPPVAAFRAPLGYPPPSWATPRYVSDINAANLQLQAPCDMLDGQCSDNCAWGHPGPVLGRCLDTACGQATLRCSRGSSA